MNKTGQSLRTRVQKRKIEKNSRSQVSEPGLSTLKNRKTNNLPSDDIHVPLSEFHSGEMAPSTKENYKNVIEDTIRSDTGNTELAEVHIYEKSKTVAPTVDNAESQMFHKASENANVEDSLPESEMDNELYVTAEDTSLDKTTEKSLPDLDVQTFSSRSRSEISNKDSVVASFSYFSSSMYENVIEENKDGKDSTEKDSTEVSSSILENSVYYDTADLLHSENHSVSDDDLAFENKLVIDEERLHDMVQNQTKSENHDSQTETVVSETAEKEQLYDALSTSIDAYKLEELNHCTNNNEWLETNMNEMSVDTFDINSIPIFISDGVVKSPPTDIADSFQEFELDPAEGNENVFILKEKTDTSQEDLNCTHYRLKEVVNEDDTTDILVLSDLTESRATERHNRNEFKPPQKRRGRKPKINVDKPSVTPELLIHEKYHANKKSRKRKGDPKGKALLTGNENLRPSTVHMPSTSFESAESETVKPLQKRRGRKPKVENTNSTAELLSEKTYHENKKKSRTRKEDFKDEILLMGKEDIDFNKFDASFQQSLDFENCNEISDNNISDNSTGLGRKKISSKVLNNEAPGENEEIQIHSNKPSLKQHSKSFRSVSSRTFDEPRPWDDAIDLKNPTYLFCNTCDKYMHNKASFENHVCKYGVGFGVLATICHNCSQAVIIPMNQKPGRGRKKFMSDAPVHECTARIFKCPYCQAAFSTKRQYKLHKLFHFEPEWFIHVVRPRYQERVVAQKNMEVEIKCDK